MTPNASPGKPSFREVVNRRWDLVLAALLLAYFLVRGEHNRPGRLIGPGVPSVLTDGKTPFSASPPWPGSIPI